ncbi:DNA adenine methylase [Cellulomonas sp. B6]|uniref:DNA adenine methylase n=1 Tax=Cellulomonas sp. B6 TaxID=1295626 RepID=UPI001CC12739|nr:DNA adenine methylase [Cellulomonas sp. B6]
MNTELQSLIALERDALARGDANLITEIVENGSVAAWAIIGGHKRAVQSDFELLLTRAAKGLEGNRSATISRYYGGVYFGYEQAAVIDALAAVAYGLEPEARDTALAAVMSTASELVASVGGHFAQPIRITTRNGQRKQGALTAVAKKRRPSAMHVFAKWLKAWSDLQPTRNPVAALRADFRDVVADLPRSVGVVYADPPYTRDHYSRFYHVLETIARGDDPGISTATSRGAKAPSRGLYRTERHQSPFSVVSEAPGALSGIAEALAMRDVSLLLSYSPVPNTEKPRDRVMTLETVLAILEANFRHVQAHVAESVGHARFNVARLNTPMTLGAEVLISCTNS